jgi:ferredoxin-type protein NapH
VGVSREVTSIICCQIDFIQCWYLSLGIGSLWFVSSPEGLESVLVTKNLYLPSLVAMAIPITLALMLGRVFCSWICPISFILERFERIRLKVSGRKHLKNTLILARRILWYTLIVELILSMIIGTPLFVFLSPPGLVCREITMMVFFKKTCHRRPCDCSCTYSGTVNQTDVLPLFLPFGRLAGFTGE